jgi:hypothetical protein
MKPNPPPTLYLRTDGTLMLARGDSTIELRLTAPQLLQLGVDCLQVAVTVDQATLPAAAAVLEGFVAPPRLLGAAIDAMCASTVTPGATCLVN